MRVTNTMLTDTFLRDMQTNLGNMKKLQEQSTSGKEIRKPSDDPSKVARAMQLHTDIDANTQYNQNIQDTINWLDTTDTAVGQAGNVLQRVRELLVSAGNAAYGPDERRALKDEINQKIGEFAQVLNTSFDGSYIFGGSRGSDRPFSSVVGENKNTKIQYYEKVEVKPEVIESDINTKWGNQQIDFEIPGNPVKTPSITLGALPVPPATTATVDDLVKEVNDQIAGNADLKDKLQAVKVEEGDKKFIKFETLTSSDIKIKESTVPALKDFKGTSSSTYNQLNMTKSKLSVEISQGVTMEYNVTAPEILNYKSGQSTPSDAKDLKDLFENIVNHLDGKVYDVATKAWVPDTTGTAVSQLTKGDLQGMTDAISNLLRVRSEVGAKQNRMDSAKEKNEDETFSMTEILSRTEDIDFTKKQMEVATMQAVYMASLQTSAKIIQPSLLDYLR